MASNNNHGPHGLNKHQEAETSTATAAPTDGEAPQAHLSMADSTSDEQRRAVTDQMAQYVEKQSDATQILGYAVRKLCALVEAQKSTSDLIWILFARALATIAALAFGVFSILSWQDAQTAIKQANAANILALVAVCAPFVNQVGLSCFDCGRR